MPTLTGSVDPRLAQRSFRREPWRTYRWLQINRPVVSTVDGRMHFVFRHDDVVRCLSARDLTTGHPFRASRRAFGRTVLDTDGEEHERVRGVIGDAFRPSRAREMEHDIVRPVVSELAWALRARSAEIDGALDRLADRLPLRVVLRLLGIPGEHEDEIAKCVQRMASQIDLGREASATVHSARSALAALVSDLLDRGRLGGIVGTRLTSADRDGELTRDEVIDNAVLLFLGGTQTTSCAIANAIALMTRHATMREALVQGGADPKQVAREALRLEPPLRFTPRFAWREIVIGSTTVPAGAALQLCVASANRDPDVYTAPASWRLDRAAPHPVTFGRGIHSCVGAALGEMEVSVALEAVAISGRVVRDDGRLRPGWTFRRPVALHLV